MRRNKQLGIFILLTVLSNTVLAEGHAEEPGKLDPAEISVTESITVNYQPKLQNRLATSGTTSAVVPSPCKLQVQNIYLRQSFGYGAVGTKAITTCSVAVTSITHDTYIQKMSLLGWNTQKVFSGNSKLSSSYSQLDVAVTCTNALKTTWTGYTNGVVVFQGVQYYATVRVANISDIFNCGT